MSADYVQSFELYVHDLFRTDTYNELGARRKLLQKRVMYGSMNQKLIDYSLGGRFIIMLEVIIMLINEVCKQCSLTKKAIEYYVAQGLILPSIQENGYRNFSDDDVSRLMKISVLRGLGLSVSDIQGVLSSQDATALYEISRRKILQITVLQEKQKLIQELVANYDWEQIQEKLRSLEKKQSILERLMNAFPGHYGRFICLHFAAYLNEPILTGEQKKAFNTIISFLDNIDFDIPDDMKIYLDEVTANIDEALIEDMSGNLSNAIHDVETYIAENREKIENYIAYKQSEEYKSTPAYRLEELLRQFNSTSGYNEIFIPAMCGLSESYRKYYKALLRADEKFKQEFPQYGQENQ